MAVKSLHDLNRSTGCRDMQKQTDALACMPRTAGRQPGSGPGAAASSLFPNSGNCMGRALNHSSYCVPRAIWNQFPELGNRLLAARRRGHAPEAACGQACSTASTTSGGWRECSACRKSIVLGPMLAPFPPAVAHRLLLSALSTVVAWHDPTYGVKSARCTEQGVGFGLDGNRFRADVRLLSPCHGPQAALLSAPTAAIA